MSTSTPPSLDKLLIEHSILQPPTDPPTPSSLEALLNRTLRITIADDRLFIGHFACTDSQSNVILAGAEEYRAAPLGEADKAQAVQRELYLPRSEKQGQGWGRYVEKTRGEGREVGMIMIPGKEVVKVELVEEEFPPRRRDDVI